MKKRRSLAILVLFLILGSQIFLIAGCIPESEKIPIPKVEANIYVYDDDNLFDKSFKEQLNTMLIDLEKKTGVEFAVITVKSLLGNTIEDYSITVANELGIGKKDKDNGVLLLMSRSDKRVRLEIGKGLEYLLNDSKCGRVLDEHFVPYRDNDDYLSATNLTVQAIINEIAADAGVSIDGVDSSITVPAEPPWGWIVFWIIVIIIIVIIILAIINHFTDGAVEEFFSNISTSSGGSSSSGGGFGGGGFGGGGASR